VKAWDLRGGHSPAVSGDAWCLSVRGTDPLPGSFFLFPSLRDAVSDLLFTCALLLL